jgi:hypothetical protein
MKTLKSVLVMTGIAGAAVLAFAAPAAAYSPAASHDGHGTYAAADRDHGRGHRNDRDRDRDRRRNSSGVRDSNGNVVLYPNSGNGLLNGVSLLNGPLLSNNDLTCGGLHLALLGDSSQC